MLPSFAESFLFQYHIFLDFKALFISLPNDKFLDCSKCKAFADDKINVIEKLKFVFGKDKKHCVKRRKCWLPAFSPFYTLHNEVEGSPWLSVSPYVRRHNFVRSFSPTVLHILLLNLYIIFVYIWSCACAIFMTILLLLVELSPLELVNFTEFLLSREIIIQYCMY